MDKFNFAEAYRGAGQSGDAETLRSRQSAFEKVLAIVDKVQYQIDLARLFFGLDVKNIEWFSTPFSESDPAFSISGNNNEVAALAGCLLEASVGRNIGTIAAQTLYASGARTPLPKSGFLTQLTTLNYRTAISWRNPTPVLPDKIQPPKKDDASAAINVAAGNLAPNSIVEALGKINSDSQAFGKSLAQQTRSVATSLVDQMNVLQEEVEILWWHIGGWSRLTNTPFSLMKTSTASIFAGIDMSSLSKTPVGPIAAPAILHRTIYHERVKDDSKLTIASTISDLDSSELQIIKISKSITRIHDVCPILTAILKAQELENNEAWHASFRKLTGIEVDFEFTPTELAMQIFREMKILNAIDSEA